MSSSPNSSSSSEERPAIVADEFAWLMDVPCQIDFVLGTTTLKVREVMEIDISSVVRLFQAAGADLEVHVRGVGLASGEVVVVDDSMAVRVNEILPPSGTERR